MFSPEVRNRLVAGLFCVLLAKLPRGWYTDAHSETPDPYGRGGECDEKDAWPHLEAAGHAT